MSDDLAESWKEVGKAIAHYQASQPDVPDQPAEPETAWPPGGAVMFRGTWEPHVEYEVGDAVVDGGIVWVATKPSLKGSRPDTRFWSLTSASGVATANSLGLGTISPSASSDPIKRLLAEQFRRELANSFKMLDVAEKSLTKAQRSLAFAGVIATGTLVFSVVFSVIRVLLN